jgi:hypothetical protein
MPFAGYKDHAACVKANSDKDDPDAYCAALERKAKESSALESVLADELNEYTIVLYGGDEPELITIKAAKYDTQGKEDWIVFYDQANEPVAEFPRWNIQGLYINL